MVKKRKLSPSASSQSSATPAPPSQGYAAPSLGGPSSGPSAGLYSASSPLGGVHDGSSVPPSDLPGPSRLSASSTPAPLGSTLNSDTARAKPGVMVAGSGDGTKDGDECFTWEGFAMNRSEYRYTFCARSPVESPSKYHPFYRSIPGPPPSPPVHISWLDRSSFLRLSVNGLTATADRGFRAARANVSVRQGSWYYEVVVERGVGAHGAGKGSAGEMGNPHVRVGWGRREASLDAPVGSDGYSYGIRDAGGEKVHLSRPKPYGNGRGFAKGDVVGCLITLPPRPQPPASDPAHLAYIQRKRFAIAFKGQQFFESPEYPVAKEMDTLIDREGKLAAAAKAAEATAAAAAAAAASGTTDGTVPGSATGPMPGQGKKKATTKNLKKGKKEAEQPAAPRARPLPTLAGSRIEFFVNGERLGPAYEDIYDFLPLPPLAPQVVPGSKRHHDPAKDALHDDGTLGYYPMISCFGRGKVRCNFGPEWIRPPTGGLPEGTRPMAERWDEFRAEELAQDIKDEQEAAERLTKELAEDAARRAVSERKAADKAQKVKKAAAAKYKKNSASATPTPAKTPQPVIDEDGVKVEPASSRLASVEPSRAVSTSGSRAASRSVSRAVSRESSAAPVGAEEDGGVKDGMDLDDRPASEADADGESEDEEGVDFGPS